MTTRLETLPRSLSPHLPNSYARCELAAGYLGPDDLGLDGVTVPKNGGEVDSVVLDVTGYTTFSCASDATPGPAPSDTGIICMHLDPFTQLPVMSTADAINNNCQFGVIGEIDAVGVGSLAFAIDQRYFLILLRAVNFSLTDDLVNLQVWLIGGVRVLR